MENGKYKLLVVDIDGTLVGEDESISVENREALAEARQQGIRVSLSTGRTIQTCLGIIEELSLDGYHIFFDGALVSAPAQDEEVYIQPLSQKAVAQTVEFVRSTNIYLELYSVSCYFVEQETWLTSMHRQIFGIEPTVVDFTKLGKRERMIKGEIWTSSPQEVARTRSFCLRFDGSLRCSWASTPAYPDINFINILAPEVSKGKALKV